MAFTNRWYGLFTPGTGAGPMQSLASQLTVQPSVAGYFLRLDTPLTPATLALYGDAGYSPFLTLEPWVYGMQAFDFDPAYSLSALNSGTYDAQLIKLASAIALYGKPVLLRLAHEANGHWYPWAVGQNGNTAQQYKDFWVHVRQLFAIAPNIQWVFSCAAVQGVRATAPTVASIYPDDDLIDFAGTTGYGWEASAHATYDPTFRRLARLTNKPFVIPEMGAQNAKNAVGILPFNWVHSFNVYLQNMPRIRGFVWFNIDQSIGATGDYRLSNPRTVDALNQLLGDAQVLPHVAVFD